MKRCSATCTSIIISNLKEVRSWFDSITFVCSPLHDKMKAHLYFLRTSHFGGAKQMQASIQLWHRLQTTEVLVVHHMLRKGPFVAPLILLNLKVVNEEKSLDTFRRLRYFRYRQDVLRLRNCITAVIALGWLEMIFWYCDYANFNITGTRHVGLKTCHNVDFTLILVRYIGISFYLMVDGFYILLHLLET